MHNGKDGIILIMVMSFLTLLMLLAGTFHIVTTMNARQTGFSVAGAEAFEQASSGADFVFGRLRADDISGVVTLQTAMVSVNYAPPTGYHFDPVTNLIRLADNRSFFYRVVGRQGDARATVEVVVGRAAVVMTGVFGNEDVSLGPNTEILSYRSSEGTAPTNSTGEGSAASNEAMDGKPDAVDGTIYLGESTAGIPASYDDEFTTPATVVRTERINPDPLGLANGALSNEFAFAAVSNDNATAIGGSISGGQLLISGNVTLRAGRYYVSEIDLIGAPRTLTIDATNGPVVIYLTGSAETGPNNTISVNPPLPENLVIYSNSSDDIRFLPQTTFVGFIYAPLASITIQPGGDFLGALWANSVDVAPNGQMYVDLDILNRLSVEGLLTRRSWKHVVP